MPLASAKSSQLPADTQSAVGRIHGGDWFWIALAVAVPVAGWLLQVVGTEQVSVIGNSQLRLPAMCYSRSWFGIDCPACGLTRSVIFFVHGQFAQSWAAHRLGWLVLLVIVAQVPYRLLVPWKQRVTQPRWSRYEALVWAGLGILLILNRIWIAFA